MSYLDPATKIDVLDIIGALLAVHRALGALRDRDPAAPNDEASWNEITENMNAVIGKCGEMMERLSPEPSPPTPHNALLGALRRSKLGTPK